MLTPSETRAREGLAYYNECDPYAAEWLRNLIAAGLITAGDVDTRSIVDVRPSDVAGYTRCHWFAGIGVWDYALGLAGWPANRPVWTGSCPCQPFSAAGGRGGFADERHLWPSWHHLIRECRPSEILGEQSSSCDGLAWLDLVQADLEGEGYACGAVDLCAAGVGRPHIRQRNWFAAKRLAHPEEAGRDRGSFGRAACCAPAAINRQGAQSSRRVEPARACAAAHGAHIEWALLRDRNGEFWSPIEPGTFPLAHGSTGRVGRLRAYGNGLDAEAAAAFIGAVIDTLSPTPGGLAEGGRL